jgi:8-oxo-dGTP diphosphatase
MPKPVTPIIAADALIELVDRPGNPIVLIKRENPPYGWAIPGGFVDVGESVPDAAVREAKEETCLDVELVCLLGCYSDPSRDPRGHTVTMIYVARASGDPVAADDAADVAVFDPVNVDVDLAFDHEKVIADYLDWRKTGSVPAIT